MATRSFIGFIALEDGKFEKTGEKTVYYKKGDYVSIYCHYDGYIDDGNGEFLHKNVKTYEEVVKLVSGGDISSIDFETKEIRYYSGNEYEKWKNICPFVRRVSSTNTDYVYVFDENGKWLVTTNNGKNFFSLDGYFS